MRRIINSILPKLLIGIFLFSFFIPIKRLYALPASCDVFQVNIRQTAISDPNGDSDNNGVSNFVQDFSQENSRPYVYFDIKTVGCLDSDNQEDMRFTIRPDSSLGVLVSNVSAADGFGFDVPSDNFTLVYLAGEEWCNDLASIDCEYDIYTRDGGTSLVSINGDQWGNLAYDCDDSNLTCTTTMSWVFKGWVPYGENHPDDTLGVTPPGGSVGTGQGPNNALLAPLPGLSSPSEDEPDQLKTFLQSIFNVAIIVAGLLAIIMIVVGAITYLSTDSISGQSNGRAMMLNAVMGLILALGAWVILNTINPNLASSLRITIPQARFNPKFEPEHSVGEGVSQVTLNSSNGPVTIDNCDESQMQDVSAFGHTFKIHHDLVDSIHDVEQAWLANGGNNWYKIDTIFGYNCRKVRGTNSWSAHAFGLAVDINPQKNPFGQNLETDMPATFVQLWTSEGWGWGGNWNNKKDAMHFSKYPPSEGGNGTMTND